MSFSHDFLTCEGFLLSCIAGANRDEGRNIDASSYSETSRKDVPVVKVEAIAEVDV